MQTPETPKMKMLQGTSDSGDTEKEPEEMNPEASETTESSADREEL